jgi:methionyl-tRNA formyltransferase
MRIVFLGSPDFAVYPLEEIAKAGYEIAAVFTQPDRSRGKRGKELLPTPVKQAALKLGVPVETPVNINSDEAIELLKAYQPDLLVVVAYGQILRQQVLAAAPLGAINIHASILPAYRGAAPIQRVLMNGEKQSGVTIIYLDEGMDSGDMIKKESFELAADETFGSLHDKLMILGGKLILEVLPQIESNQLEVNKQNENEATFAPKISREEELINWQNEAKAVHNQIRAMDPNPGAYTFYGEKRLKLFASSLLEGSGQAGQILRISDYGIDIACSLDAVRIGEVQLAGKRKMSAADFARGYQIKVGGSI